MFNLSTRAFRSKIVPFLIGVLLASAATGAAPADHLPEPPAAQQASVEKVIRDTFKVEYAKTAPADRRDLAKKLLEQALQPDTTDAAEQFVLLREACDVASDAGDARVATIAIDELGDRFAIKSEAEMRVASVVKAAAKATTSELRKELAAAALRAADSCLAADDFSSANKLSAVVTTPALRAADVSAPAADLKARLTDAKKMAAEYAKVRSARDTLATRKDDPAANLDVGRYECFMKGDWANGLPRLAQSSDKALVALAKSELSVMESKEPAAAEQKKVADGWWDYANALTGRSRSLGRAHAAAWYRDAQRTGLSGLSAVSVKKRLEEIDADITANSGDGKGGRVINLMPLVDLKRDVDYGEWTLEAGVLRCKSTYNVPRVELPWEPPAEYDMKVEWSQAAIRYPVHLILAKGESSFVLSVAQDAVGFVYVDSAGFKGMEPSNPTFVSTPDLLQPNRRYTAVVRVRNKGCEAFVNGKKITRFETDYNNVKVDRWFVLKHQKQLGLGCDNPVDFHSVEVSPVTGTGKRTDTAKPSDKGTKAVGK